MRVGLEPLGDAALVLRFGSAISPAVSARLLAARQRLLALALPGVFDVVPAYATLTLSYDPLVWSFEALAAQLECACAEGADENAAPAGRRVELPVCYEPPHAPDLAAVARHAQLPESEVVRRHSGVDYRVYFLGFTPGFPYLGGLDPALATPRRATPRAAVPAGSVAIGGGQTGVYPMRTPGGWHLVGCTPLRLFDAARDPCCLLAPGDTVRFVPIDGAVFARLAAGGEP